MRREGLRSSGPPQEAQHLSFMDIVHFLNSETVKGSSTVGTRGVDLAILAAVAFRSCSRVFFAGEGSMYLDLTSLDGREGR